MIKKIFVIFLLFWLFSFPCFAEEEEDFFQSQLEIIGAEDLPSALPEDAADYFNEYGIDMNVSDWANSLTAEGVFSHIWEFIRTGAKAPLKSGALILSIILVSAAVAAMEAERNLAVTQYATCLAAAAAVALPLLSVISSAAKVMKGGAAFMSAFVPVFAVAVASSGGVVTAASMSAVLLGATQAVSIISNFAVVPVMSGYMALSLASSVSEPLAVSGICETIKKTAFWVMSLISTVFVGILSIQSVVNATAETVTVKAAKFIVSSAVPVAGTALSEAITTVTASMGLLKASVGIYGVAAVIIIFAPILAELLVWRLVLLLTSAVAEIFSQNKISKFLKSGDAVLSVLVGILLLTSAMFIISLSVVLTVGKTQ